MGDAFRRNNHYVSRGYLKRWASSQKRVWSYRTLASHSSVPLWKERSIRGVAYHSHLYTRLVAGRETDEIERWLEREFETPAAEALEKATSGGRLTPNDWKLLVRFLAAQDVRTPARLFESFQRWSRDLPEFLEGPMRDSVRKIEKALAAGEKLESPETTHRDGFPLRVTTEIKPGEENGVLRGEMVTGRGLWLWSVRHLLTNTATVLHKHRWTILSPPEGFTWFTSDDPVIRLNFHSLSKYDFEGGWDSKGTHIMLPLSPHHLLYAQVGYRPPPRGDVMPPIQTKMIRRFIAEHAARMIFAAERDAEVAKLRPRAVSAEQVKREREQWAEWHEEQVAAERELMGWEWTAGGRPTAAGADQVHSDDAI